ncbi:uncharacterized protein C3orf22 homolog isoform X1 [Macaca fascicularis]|uniref:uncharacterized protein C3orf22 homolog isoform X1 n=1 Tax=Macaca fascicularis TaxID=9541 RepID=UPI0032B041AC
MHRAVMQVIWRSAGIPSPAGLLCPSAFCPPPLLPPLTSPPVFQPWTRGVPQLNLLSDGLQCPQEVSPGFSGLTEPDPEPLHPWEVTNNLNTVELPLQKRLVPTRSIPVRGLGASDFISPSSSRPAPLPAPPPPPLCNLWELKLLSRRFPRQLAFLLSAPHTKATGPQTSEAKGPSRGRS